MTPTEEATVRAALALRASGRPSRVGDRAIRAGRGVRVGLHELLTLVLVRWYDPAERCMAAGHYFAIVWLDEPPEPALATVMGIVAQHQGDARVTVEVRRATWLARLAGWWAVSNRWARLRAWWGR